MSSRSWRMWLVTCGSSPRADRSRSRQSTGVREVSVNERTVVNSQHASAIHDDGRSAGRRRDSRRHLR